MFTHPCLIDLLESYRQKYGDIFTIYMGKEFSEGHRYLTYLIYSNK